MNTRIALAIMLVTGLLTGTAITSVFYQERIDTIENITSGEVNASYFAGVTNTAAFMQGQLAALTQQIPANNNPYYNTGFQYALESNMTKKDVYYQQLLRAEWG